MKLTVLEFREYGEKGVDGMDYCHMTWRHGHEPLWAGWGDAPITAEGFLIERDGVSRTARVTVDHIEWRRVPTSQERLLAAALQEELRQRNAAPGLRQRKRRKRG